MRSLGFREVADFGLGKEWAWLSKVEWSQRYVNMGFDGVRRGYSRACPGPGPRCAQLSYSRRARSSVQLHSIFYAPRLPVEVECHRRGSQKMFEERLRIPL